MPLLPYSKTTLVDKTIGLPTAVPPPSINIASIIQSNTGPVDRMELSSQTDLINNYCLGNAITATDNETIQFNGSLLTRTRLDVIRVDSSTMRIGVGSSGNKIYFDTEGNLISEITRANITEKGTVWDSLYAYDDTNVYYIGERPSSDEVSGLTEIELSPTSDLSLKNFFNLLSLQDVILGHTASDFVFNNNSGLKFREDLKIGTTTEEGAEDITSDIIELSGKAGGTFSSEDHIMIGKYTYFDPLGTLNGSEFNYPIGIRSSVDEQSLTPELFIGLIALDAVKNNTFKTPLGIDLDLGIKVGSTEKSFTLNDTFSKSIKVTTDGKALYGGYLSKVGSIVVDIDDKYYESVYGLHPGSTLIGNDQMSPAEWLYELARELSPTLSPELCTKPKSGNGGIYLDKESSPTISIHEYVTGTFTAKPFSDDNTVIIKSDILTDEEFETVKPITDLHLVIDNSVVFYAGTRPSVPNASEFIKLSSASIPYSEFMNKFIEAVNARFIMSEGVNNNYIFSGSHKITTTSEGITIGTTRVIDQTKYADKFAIVTKFNSDVAMFDFEYKYNDDDYETFDLEYQFKDIINKIVISFKGDAIDGYGTSLYYEKYNSGDYSNPYIKIVDLGGIDYFKTFSPGFFGDEVRCGEPTDAAFAEAALKFKDETDKHYQFITDGGKCSIALAGACQQVADERYAMYVPSFPVEYKKAEDFVSYAEALGLNNAKCHLVVPAHKNTYNGNFLTTVPGNVPYMLARVNAFNTVSLEFMPLFGSTNGIVSAPNLVSNFNKVDQQTLLDHNINSIIKDSAGTYIKSNFTSQKVASYLQEDKNIYMSNIIAQICQTYDPLVQARLNDRTLWLDTISELTRRITERLITGKAESLTKFKVVCDATLNTEDVINAREFVYEVWVQYTPSVAYVKSYVNVMKLGSF